MLTQPLIARNSDLAKKLIGSKRQMPTPVCTACGYPIHKGGVYVDGHPFCDTECAGTPVITDKDCPFCGVGILAPFAHRGMEFCSEDCCFSFRAMERKDRRAARRVI